MSHSHTVLFAWSRRLMVGSCLSLALWLANYGAHLKGIAAAQQPSVFTSVSAASYRADSLAPETIVAGFGLNLATETLAGRDSDPNTPGIQLPTTLAGTTVRVNNVLAPLFFVSPGQINYLIPPNTPLGDVQVEVTPASGARAVGTINLRQVAPAIFTANADGLGVPASVALRVAANGAQTYENIFARNTQANRLLATPINLGPEGEKVFLILFLSGIRRAPDPNNDGNLNEFVRVVINGLQIVPAYAGPQGTFVGLDQINVEVPRSLLGSASLDVQVLVNGFGISNTTGIELVAPAVTNLSFRPLGLPNRTLRAFATIGSYLFAATNLGVWCSSDSGANWINVSNGLPPNADVRTLVVDGSVLYAGLAGGGGVCVSYNNGQSWIALNTGLVGSTLNISNLLFFNGLLYAATQGGVCRYNGTTWVSLNNGLTNVDSATLLVYGGRLCVGTRGGGIFLLGSGSLWGSLSNGLPSGAQVISFANAGAAVFAGLNGGGLCISRNSGALWTQVAGGFPSSAIVNSIWIDGLRIYVATSTGVYVSNDYGGTWVLLSTGLSGCNGASNTNVVQAIAGRLLAGSTGCGVYGSALAAGLDNRTPVAFAQTLALDEDMQRQISLSGFDADLDALTYQIVANPQRGGLSGVLPNVVYTPNSNYNGADIFTFRVNDGRTNSLTAAVNLIINPVNDAPLITAPATVTVTAGSTVNFQIGVNDLDGDALTLTSSTLPQGATFSTNTRQFAWMPTVAGTYPITFTVSDGILSASATTTITVNPQVIPWQTLGTGLSGIGKVWDLYASGETIYAAGDSGIWRSTNGGTNWSAFSTGLATSRLVYRLAFINSKLYAATTGGLFVLNDVTGSWTRIINGLPTNAAILSVAGAGTTLFVGTQGAGTFRSTDGGAMFSIFSSQAFGATSQAVSLFIAGDYILAGGYGTSGQGLYRSLISSPNWTYVSGFGLDFPVSFQRVNNTIYAGGSGYVYLSTNDGASWTIPGVQAQGTGQFYGFVVTEAGIYGAGTGGVVVFTLNNGVTWTRINEGITSNQTIGLIRDGNRLLLGGVNAVFTRLLSGASSNRAPVLNAQGPFNAVVGSQLSFSISATDPDAGQILTYAASNLPTGAGFNPNTRVFSWTPMTVGTFTVNFTVTDNGTPSLSDTETVTINVSAANRPPVLTVPAAQSATVLQPLSFPVSATDPDAGQLLTFAALNLPTGAAFNPNTRQFTWTPASNQVGTFTVTFTVADNGAPSLGDTKAVTITVTGGSGGPLTWTKISTGLPTTSDTKSVAASGNTIFVTYQHTHGVYRSTNGGANWSQFITGLPSVNCYGLTINGNDVFVAVLGTGSVYRTTLNGTSWTVSGNGISSSHNIWSLYAKNGTLYAGAFTGQLYRSTDNGANWTSISNGLPNSGNPILNVILANGDTLFAGYNAAGLFRSTDNGANWSQVSNGISATGYVVGLQQSGNTLFIGFLSAGTIFRSTDNGASWASVSTGLPTGTGGFVECLVAAGNSVYAGFLFQGVSSTSNNGDSWAANRAGLPAQTVALALYADGANIYLAVGANTGGGSGVYRATTGP